MRRSVAAAPSPLRSLFTSSQTDEYCAASGFNTLGSNEQRDLCRPVVLLIHSPLSPSSGDLLFGDRWHSSTIATGSMISRGCLAASVQPEGRVK
jgi:hypothetical protein